MAWGDNGTLLVGSRDKGQVSALGDGDADGRADSVKVIAKGLHMPVGLAFRDGALYVSAVDRILRFDAIESRLDSPPEPVAVIDDLPDKDYHGWRYIARSEEHKSELQSLMPISYAVFCLKTKKKK